MKIWLYHVFPDAFLNDKLVHLNNHIQRVGIYIDLKFVQVWSVLVLISGASS